jgi:hypothetical protein
MLHNLDLPMKHQLSCRTLCLADKPPPDHMIRRHLASGDAVSHEAPAEAFQARMEVFVAEFPF